MAWGDKGGWQGGDSGPWGRSPSGGGGGGQKPPGGNGPGKPPDFDEWVRKFQEQMRRFSPGSGHEKSGLIVLGVVVLLLWLASGIYFVRADQQGVVMRFGAFERTSSPGLNYHMPYPIERVETPRVTAVNHVEIGYRSGGTVHSVSDNRIAEESLMLTGDENIIDIDFEVQWKINNAPNFLFNVRNPEETVKAVSESAMREIIGQTPIATVLAEGKLQVEQGTKQLIQQTLDSYKAGIEVVSVNLLMADPPAQVIDAFRDVQTARADMETARNQAEAYQNDIIPRARGDAQKMVLDAEAYKQEVIAHAQGDAARFQSVYAQYKNAKDVTKKRMYLETMEDILQGMNKIIIEPKNGAGVLPYFPLSDLKPKSEESAK